MAYILNLETATKNCSVSLSFEGKTLSFKEIATEGFSHAEKLHVFVQEVIAQAGISMSDLGAVAVSQGPGSYTGLRIGVSAAKGLCYALNIPLIALDTLEVMARSAAIEDGVLIPVIDARRMEVYSAIFDASYAKIRAVEAQIIDENAFAELTEKCYLLGDCLEKLKPVLTNEKFVYLEANTHPSAKEMSAMGFEKFLKKDFVDVAYFEPFYLKDFLVNAPKK